MEENGKMNDEKNSAVEKAETVARRNGTNTAAQTEKLSPKKVSAEGRKKTSRVVAEKGAKKEKKTEKAKKAEKKAEKKVRLAEIRKQKKEAKLKAKLAKKHADLAVANDVTQTGAGFDVDTNVATIIDKDGNLLESGIVTKRALADCILDKVLAL